MHDLAHALTLAYTYTKNKVSGRVSKKKMPKNCKNMPECHYETNENMTKRTENDRKNDWKWDRWLKHTEKIWKKVKMAVNDQKWQELTKCHHEKKWQKITKSDTKGTTDTF